MHNRLHRPLAGDFFVELLISEFVPDYIRPAGKHNLIHAVRYLDKYLDECQMPNFKVKVRQTHRLWNRPSLDVEIRLFNVKVFKTEVVSVALNLWLLDAKKLLDIERDAVLAHARTLLAILGAVFDDILGRCFDFETVLGRCVEFVSVGTLADCFALGVLVQSRDAELVGTKASRAVGLGVAHLGEGVFAHRIHVDQRVKLCRAVSLDLQVLGVLFRRYVVKTFDRIILYNAQHCFYYYYYYYYYYY